MNSNSSEVTVFVRTSPTTKFAQELIEYLPDENIVNIYQRREGRQVLANHSPCSWSFHVDGVLHLLSQEEVYARVAQEVVLAAMEGYNGTVMCFGQTGSGKTYTMTGTAESYQQRGIIPRALQQVFQEVATRRDRAFSVHLSYLEIYNETLVDLICPPTQASPTQAPPTLAVVEEPGGGVSIRGLSLHPVHSEDAALDLLFEGEMNRVFGAHALNKSSSRSHCIFTLYIESRSRLLLDATYVTSKVNLVDLAGSERPGKTGSEGQTFREATHINKSLSFLEQAILALADRHREHVPFRQSRLTHALKDSLGGNCNTVLVANIRGEAAQIQETLSTLRFASRMKCVRTKPTINQHVDPALQIKSLQKEVEKLREELSIHNLLVNRAGSEYAPLSKVQRAEIRGQVQRYLDGRLEDISIISVRQLEEVFSQFKLAVHERVKAKLRQTYMLVEKDPSAAPANSETWDPKGGVGEEVVGVATCPERHTAHVKSKGRKARDTTTASSPPPKAEAFEEFKATRGAEVNAILKSQKAVLQQRRARLCQLIAELDATKREMDATAASVQQHRDARAAQGPLLSGESSQQEILDEVEASLMQRLADLKARYRPCYNELSSTRAEVNYCQHLVDRCSVRLFTEFESWYDESVPLPDEVLVVPSGGPIQPGLVTTKTSLSLGSLHQVFAP